MLLKQIMERNLLIIDDEQCVLDSLSRALWDAGYGLTTTTNPVEALEMIKFQAPRVVVTDLNMRAMDGIDVLQRIKGLNPLIQVVLITGFDSGDKTASAMRNGAHDFILKPFNKREFMAVVNRAFDVVSLLEENFLIREKMRGSPRAGCGRGD